MNRAANQKFWTDVLEVPRSYFVDMAWICFLPWDVPILRQNQYSVDFEISESLSCLIVQLNILEGTTKASGVDVFEGDHLKRHHNCFLTPKRYNEAPLPFYVGISLPPPKECNKANEISMKLSCLKKISSVKPVNSHMVYLPPVRIFKPVMFIWNICFFQCKMSPWKLARTGVKCFDHYKGLSF